MPKCSQKYCRHNVRSKGLCNKHYTRQWRENNAVRYAFITLRDNAKRREKEFEITFEQFQEFCIETKYLKGKGIRSESFHIDRKEEDKGYTIDNIQVLTNAQNIRKSMAYRIGENGKPTDFHVITHRPSEPSPDCPF